MIPKEAPLIVLDRKYAMCMAKNGKDTKHNRHIARRMHFSWKIKKCKMHKLDWCKKGLQLADIVTKNVSESDLSPRMKYIMVRHENGRQTTCTRGMIEYTLIMRKKSS